MVKDMAVSIMKCLDEGVKKVISESEDTSGDTEEVSHSQGTFRVWGLGLGAWGLGLGVWGLGFGAWGLEFGAWSLGLGVWGLGLV